MLKSSCKFRRVVASAWRRQLWPPMERQKAGILLTSRSMSTSGAGDGEKPRIVVFYGSVRQGRHADAVGTFVKRVLSRHGMEPVTFDPAQMPFEMLKTPIHFYPPKDQDKIPPTLREANEEIRNADGFVIVSPEYNGLPPPALTNMLNHFPRTSYIHRPLGFVSYTAGAFGGIRAVMSMRSMTGDFGMIHIPTTVYIPSVQHAFDEKTGKCNNELAKANIEHFSRELLWYSMVLKKNRADDPPRTR